MSKSCSPTLCSESQGKFPQLPEGLIATVIDDAHKHFDHSKVRDFVLLLVERRASNELASHRLLRYASKPVSAHNT